MSHRQQIPGVEFIAIAAAADIADFEDNDRVASRDTEHIGGTPRVARHSDKPDRHSGRIDLDDLARRQRELTIEAHGRRRAAATCRDDDRDHYE